MAMRESCKHFESRTYPDGETARKCALDLAPEAPWRCPEECARFEPRLADVNWSHGSLISPATPEEPDSLNDGDSSVGELLDEAEDIINAVVDRTQAEVDAQRSASARHPSQGPANWRRWFRRG